MNKIEVYKKHTKTNKQIFLAMITAYGLKPSTYSEELITGQVSWMIYFKNNIRHYNIMQIGLAFRGKKKVIP